MPGRDSEVHTRIGLCSEAGMWPIWSGQLGRDSSLLTPIYSGPAFQFGLRQSMVSSRGECISSWLHRTLLAWELKPHLEDRLSQGEMEVTPEATDGASRESQAGKGDSPRTVQFLGLFCSQKINQGTIQPDKKWFEKYWGIDSKWFWFLDDRAQCFKQTFL